MSVLSVMADPLSVAASIAGLLALADSAFRGVFRYSKAVSSAQDDVKALGTELRSIASVLHGVKLLAETMIPSASLNYDWNMSTRVGPS